MDWSKIEKEVQHHTAVRLHSRERYQQPSTAVSLYTNSREARKKYATSLVNYTSDGSTQRAMDDKQRTVDQLPPPPTSIENEFDVHVGSNSGDAESHAILTNDINEMKSMILKQNERIKALELAIDKRDVALAITSKQELIQDRIDRVEVDLQSCSKQVQSISHESSELEVQAKACSGRLAWIEDMYRSASQEYVTKKTFSQLLTSCMEQLKDVNTAAESARANGTQCIQLVESFMAAISNLQSSQPGYSLEFLIGLSGEKQREQIASAISDALKNAISREVELSSSRMRGIIESVNGDVKREMTSTLHEIREQIAEHGKELGEEVFRNTEISMKSIQDISKQMDRQKRMIEAELSTFREAHQVYEIEQSEGRLSLQRVEDTLSKVQSVTFPTVQRNHKSLVDEVIRIEGEQSTISSHMGDMDKNIARINSQLKLITKTTASLEQNERNRRERNEKVDKENIPAQDLSNFVPDTCKTCQQTSQKLASLGDIVQRLTTSTDKIETSMDILQAEIGSMSKENEENGVKLRKIKTDLDDYKAGVMELENSSSELKTHGCSLAKQCYEQLQTLSSARSATVISPKSLKGIAVKSPQVASGPTNALADAIARTKSLTDTTKKALGSSYSIEEMKKKPNKIPPKPDKDLHSPPPKCSTVSLISKKLDTNDRGEALLSEESVKNHNGLTVSIDKKNQKVDYEIDDDDDVLSAVSSSPSQSPKKMSESNKLADSLDESISSITEHCNVTPVKVTHTPEERSKIIKGLMEKSSSEQGEYLIRQYDVSSSDVNEFGDRNKKGERDDDESSVCSSSFEESESFHEDMATILSPSKNSVTYTITDNSTNVDTNDETDKKQLNEIDTDEGKKKVDFATESKKVSVNSGPETDDDDGDDYIGKRFDKLGNFIPDKKKEENVAQAPMVSGTLLGRKKSMSTAESIGDSALTSTSIKRSNATTSSSSSAAGATSSSHRSANQGSNTAQCTFCLRRMPVDEVRNHMKSCELRTELCKYGCRSKVLVIKMDKHLDICPKNPKNMDD